MEDLRNLWKSSHYLAFIAVICPVGTFRNYPWEGFEAKHMFWENFSSFAISMCLVIGYLLLTFLTLKMYKRDEIIVKGKTKAIFQRVIVLKLVKLAFIYSAYYTILAFVAYSLNGKTDLSEFGIYIIKGQCLLVAIRTWVILAIFLTICALLFEILYIKGVNGAVSFLLVMPILFYDMAFQLKFEISPVKSFVLPSPLDVQVNLNQFIVSLIYLGIVSIILYFLAMWIWKHTDSTNLKKREE